MGWNYRKINELFAYLGDRGFEVTQYGVRSMIPKVGFGIYAELIHKNSNALVSLALPEGNTQAAVWLNGNMIWTDPDMDFRESLLWNLNEVINGSTVH